MPVDPHLQHFMANVLDDLTRPAPPTGLAVASGTGRVRVRVAGSVDPRVVGFVATARVGARWRRICHGGRWCRGLLPADASLVGAVAIDRWGRTSTAAYARP